MLIDLHTHSYPISSCARATFAEIIEHSKEVGLDGIVLANHYEKSYVTGKEITHKEFLEEYINEFKAARAYADQIGFKVFFAIELTVEKIPYCHLLIYGVPFEFLYENPEIYDLDQEEIYRLVKEYGGALIQAHPYRRNVGVLDANYLDGIEINCHARFGVTNSREILEVAHEKALHITCGSDYHATHRRPKCGMVIPDDITDSIQLKDYILSESEKTLLVDELNDEEPAYITVER